MKYPSLLLAVAMLLPNYAFAAYPDVDASHENGRAIEYLQEKGIMTGYPNGDFGPDRRLSRAELMKILVESSVGAPNPSFARQCFPDIEVDSWYAAYVCYAKDQGWVSGYPDGTFRPAQDVLMVESVKMLVNARGYEVTKSAIEYGVGGEWFMPYMFAALRHYILSNDTYWARDPGENYDDPITRKRIAEFIYRALWTDGQLSLRLDLNPQCNPADVVSVKLGGESYDYPDFIATMRDGTDCTLATDVNPLSRVSKHLVWGIMEVATNRDGQWGNYVQDGKAYFRAICECDGGDIPGIFELNLETGEMAEFIAGKMLISSDYRYFVGMEGDERGTITVYDRKTHTTKNAVELNWPQTLSAGMHDQGFGGINMDTPHITLDGTILHYTVFDAGTHSPDPADDDIADYKKLYDQSVDLNTLFGN